MKYKNFFKTLINNILFIQKKREQGTDFGSFKNFRNLLPDVFDRMPRAFIAIAFSCALVLLGSCQHTAGPTCDKTLTLLSFEDTTLVCGWGFKDQQGQVVIPPQYCAVFQDAFVDRVACVVDARQKTPQGKNRLIAIDKCNNFVLEPFTYDNGPDYVREGVFRFWKDGKLGFADKDGNAVIPPQFDFAGPFDQGMTGFCMGCKPQTFDEYVEWRGGKWGFIDIKGKVVIPAVYDAVQPFKGGFSLVTQNGQQFYINRKGQKIE